MSEVQRKLAAAGVFAGLSGLEIFLEAGDFWQELPYGTRLYFGPGGGQYLHRSVLRAAVELLKEPAPRDGAELLQVLLEIIKVADAEPECITEAMHKLLLDARELVEVITPASHDAERGTA